jgi:hypothetical protein
LGERDKEKDPVNLFPRERQAMEGLAGVKNKLRDCARDGRKISFKSIRSSVG